jgi:hypothetical protein
MIVLPNVQFDLLRSVYSPSYGTGAATPYAENIVGHLTRIKDSQLVVAPSLNGALKAIYEVYVDTSVDIRKGDILINIMRLGTEIPFIDIQDQETWRVMDANNSSPGFLEYRDVVVGRFVGSGPYV